MQFEGKKILPNKFLDKQSNKMLLFFSLRFAEIAPENSGLWCLQ